MLSRAGPHQDWHEKIVAGTREIWPSWCFGVFWYCQCCKLFYYLSICISSGTDLCILINTSVRNTGWRVFESNAVGITPSFAANTTHSYISIIYCISIILFLQEDTARCCFFCLLFSFNDWLWCWWKMSPYLRLYLRVSYQSLQEYPWPSYYNSPALFFFTEKERYLTSHLIVPLFPSICKVPLLTWEERSLRLLSVQVVLPWRDAPLPRTWQWRCVEAADKTGNSLVTEIPAVLCPYQTD